MCCALLEKRQYKQHDAEMWNLHIAGILNSENLIQYKLKISLNTYGRRRWGQSTAWKIHTIEQRRGRNGEEEGWWKNFCVSTRSRTRHPLYDDQWIRHYLKTPSWIQNSNQYPRFHVPSLFPHYCTHNLCEAKLLHKILLFIYLFIYFIILPQTMNYKQNKNDNK